MGTDRYGEKKPGFDHITLRTNPYKSVQKNAQSTFFGSGGSTALRLFAAGRGSIAEIVRIFVRKL